MRAAFYSFLLSGLIFLSAPAIGDPASGTPSPAKPEKFGFKEIPFGISKETFIRVLCVKYGFRQANELRHKSFAEMKPLELMVLENGYCSKYKIGPQEVEARFLFDSNNKFSEVGFEMDAGGSAGSFYTVLEKAGFFNKMLETKYGAAAKKNTLDAASLDTKTGAPLWEWERPTARIFTFVRLNDGRYRVAAHIVDAR